MCETIDRVEKMSEIKLLPCPFCGGEAIMQIVEPHTHVFAKFMVDCKGESFIECTKCTCSMSGQTDKEVIEKWNTRKPMERIIERLKKIINRAKKEEKQNNDVVDTAMRCSYENSMKIVKEEGGIE